MGTPLSQEEKVRRGAENAGKYFRYMMDFVGFGADEARAIKDSGLVIEKYIPDIVADFYAHLLRYPPTRTHFLREDGTVDQDYLQKRMHHLANFWRRTASGVYDDDYARYVDYVGLAHTSHGADPTIYIAERYVIGQVGFMQRAITEALVKELREYDPDLEKRAVRAWNMLMMVILELLARAYREEHEQEPHSGAVMRVNEDSVRELAVQAYEMGLGLGRPPVIQKIRVAEAASIPDGERKVIDANGISIGLFHHRGGWYALRNHCLHAGGPVCTGDLEGDTLTCPWHGYQYNLPTGELLVDPSVHLEQYPISIVDGEIYLSIPEEMKKFSGEFFAGPDEPEAQMPEVPRPAGPVLAENEFDAALVLPGKTALVRVGGVSAAVYNVGGRFYATANACTHADGPLNQGDLDGQLITCPWHGSQFDVTSGAVCRGPAKAAVQVFKVTVEGGVGRVSAS
jgi:nitrite reductase/ring-hydroxylating ferredoxin subunit